MTPKKTTPSNCYRQNCPYNLLAPPENSQECIGCPYLNNPKWKPKEG
jgi:hypothetical protein